MQMLIIANKQELQWNLLWNQFHLKLWFQLGSWMIKAWNDQAQLKNHYEFIQGAIKEIQINAKLLAQNPTPAQFWIAHRHEMQFATTKKILQPLIANQISDWNPIIQNCQTWMNNLSYCWMHQNAINKLTILVWFCRFQSELIAINDLATTLDFTMPANSSTKPTMIINFDTQKITLQPPTPVQTKVAKTKLQVPRNTPTLMTTMSFSEFLMWSEVIFEQRYQALWLKDQEIATLYQLN